jgi:hypothetical protein
LIEEKEQDIPLSPISDLTSIIKKRNRKFKFVMLLSLPSSLVAMLLYMFLILINGFTPGFSQIATFIFLSISSALSVVALLLVPEYLDGISNAMEKASRSIAFTLTSPEGKTSPERILKQLIKTDYRIKKVVQEKPEYAQLNAHVKDKNNSIHDFDVLIFKPRKVSWNIFSAQLGFAVFARYFDQIEPINSQEIKNFKKEIESCLKVITARIPTRVLVVSTSGFDDDVFSYTRSKTGVFRSFAAYNCKIELIKENTNGSFEVLSF